MSVKFSVTSGDLSNSGKSGRTFWTCPKPGTDSVRMTTPFEVCYVSVLSVIHLVTIHYSSVLPPVKGAAVCPVVCALCALCMCPSVWIWYFCYLSLSFQFTSAICPLFIRYSFMTQHLCFASIWYISVDLTSRDQWIRIFHLGSFPL